MRHSTIDRATIAAPITIDYCRKPTQPTSWYVCSAFAKLLEVSGLSKHAVDGLALSTFTSGPDTAAFFAHRMGLTLRWVVDLPMGGAAGLLAVRRAVEAVRCGDAQVVACIGADSMTKSRLRKLVENYSSLTRNYAWPYGEVGPTGIFALMTNYYMTQFGATREDFGRICVAQRQAAISNPRALLRSSLTIEEYLAARPIVSPLHLYDCVMPCAGAEAFLVLSKELAQRMSLPHADVLSSFEIHNSFPEDVVQYRGGWHLGAGEMYSSSSLGPEDMDFLQAYDDYPVVVMHQLEGLGFCEIGGAPEFIRTHSLRQDDGDLPVNTGGGQLSCGQAGAAGGFLGINEGLRRLTDSAQQAQHRPFWGLVSGYGYVDFDRGVCSAAAIIGRQA